jgi:hypothetical protein
MIFYVTHWSLQRRRLLPLTEVLLPLFCPAVLHGEEVSRPKTINIKQYLNTNNFSVNNRHLVIKPLQVTHHFTPETKNVEFYDVKKNYLMAAINTLNRLIFNN